MPLAGLAAATALTVVPPHRRPTVLGGVGALLVLQTLSLAVVALRFYA